LKSLSLRKLAAAAAIGALSVTVFAVGAASADQPGLEHMAQMQGNGNGNDAGHGRPGGGGGVSNLVDHGGPVLPSAHLYAIWWGPASGWPSDANSSMTNFFQNFGSSSYLQIAKQYMRGSGLTTTYGGSFTDSSTPPAKLGTTTVAGEISHVLNGAAPDPNGIYVVLTSTFPRGGNFCAWHTGASVNGVQIAEAYIPNTANVFGCGTPGGATSVSAQTDSIGNVTAHELMESITDPQPSGSSYGWIDNGGQEIGDKCAWQFANTVHIGSLVWQLQEEWSNAISGCAQGS
jgi:hypothetical protein